MDALSNHQSEPDALKHRTEFAALLKQARCTAGLTVRELASTIGYTHPHVARATTGDRLPSWTLTSAYLDACGIRGPDLRAWRQFWEAARLIDREFRSPDFPPSEVNLVDDPTWQVAAGAVRRIEPLGGFVRSVSTLEGLSVALRRLSVRSGFDSLRKIESATGIPRATLHGWFAAKRRPNSASLDRLLTSLGTTENERYAFAACLDRIDAQSRATVSLARLSATHELPDAPAGFHRTARDRYWLDG
ncbi:helix-turn-helix domain-containing protein [Kribbella sp. NBC_01505]|uniref:helix-turn-helix domain-containing protein n=1 Tax=Kribbella sp. NBC_01505 TaxID=2903580 RepID=UPI00386EFD35